MAQSVGAIEYTDAISAEGKTPHECPRHDTELSEDNASVMLTLWGMWSIPSLPLLPGPFWVWVVAPERVLSMGHIELNWVLMLNWIIWKRTVCTSV